MQHFGNKSFPQSGVIIIDGHNQTFSKYSNKFAIALQYLKKEDRNGVYFCMQMNFKVSTMALSFLMEVARHVQSTQEEVDNIFAIYTIY